jgi:hypothetical protein
MAVAHRSIKARKCSLAADRSHPVLRLEGKYPASGVAPRRSAANPGSPKRETWRLLCRHEHEPALRGNLI